MNNIHYLDSRMEECGVLRRRQSRRFAVAIAVKCLVTFIILVGFQAMGRSSDISFSFFQSTPTLDIMDYFASTVSSGMSARGFEAHRHLLNFDNSSNSNSSGTSNSSSTASGLKAALIHRPSLCSPPFPDNTSSSVSKEYERVEHLKCALQKSSTRVEYLLGKRSHDRKSVIDGLPTKYIPEPVWSVDEQPEEAGQQFFVREILGSPEWQESYESDVWSQSGEYIMTIQIGSPPRTLTGIVDTGSDLTWVQCHRCQRCYQQTNPIYEPRSSKTYAELDCFSDACEELSMSFCNIFSDNCDYMYTYGDESFTYGTLSTDSFTFTSTKGQVKEFPNILFGCSHSSRGTFTTTRADGVVGLGRGPISLASQLGSYFTDMFGYCLLSRNDPTEGRSLIYFGDNARLTGDGVGYTPLITNKRYKAYYYVNMTGITVGEKRLDIDPAVFSISANGRGGTVLDSGTTVTNLVSTAFDSLETAWRAAVSYPTKNSRSRFEVCHDVHGISDLDFPKLVFHFDGVDLDLPLENYVVIAEEDTLCLAIDRSSASLTVMGNIQQQNIRVLYDRENSRIGFQPTTCKAEDQ